MAIPNSGSMLAFRSKDAKQKRKRHSQNNTDIQPSADRAALPTMARYTGLDHEPLRRSPTAPQSLSQVCQLRGDAIRRHVQRELPRGTP